MGGARIAGRKVCVCVCASVWLSICLSVLGRAAVGGGAQAMLGIRVLHVSRLLIVASR